MDDEGEEEDYLPTLWKANHCLGISKYDLGVAI